MIFFMKRFASVITLLLFFLIFALLVPGSNKAYSMTEQPYTFSDINDIWGNGLEAAIERAYRRCFKTYIIDGSVMTLQIPFAQYNERTELTSAELYIEGKGKADPDAIWAIVDNIILSQDFSNYIATLKDNTEKVLIFDLGQKKWSYSKDLFDISRMKAGSYRGLPHKPYVLVKGDKPGSADVYNYLFCIARVGMDCSGFVWHTISAALKEQKIDLAKELKAVIKIPEGADPSLYIGASFFDSNKAGLKKIKDSIKNLKTGDILLFRGEDGSAVHSAIIQSVNFEKGFIRYLQSTDEAPLNYRGVHESLIRFDPLNLDLSLKDPAVEWTQARYPPFPGEKPSPFSNDGERYRAYPEKGGGAVVRLAAAEKAHILFKSLNP